MKLDGAVADEPGDEIRHVDIGGDGAGFRRHADEAAHRQMKDKRVGDAAANDQHGRCGRRLAAAELDDATELAESSEYSIADEVGEFRQAFLHRTVVVRGSHGTVRSTCRMASIGADRARPA